MSAQESKVRLEQEEKAQAVALRVAAATLEQLKLQLDGDLARIRQKLGTKDTKDVETAKDMKYIRDRQKLLGSDVEMVGGLLFLQARGDLDH